EPQADLKRSLSVDGEIIGEIALSGLDELDEDAQVILHQVITKASNRLWTLHLVEQTEQALTQTEAQAEQLRQLNELGNALSETQTMNEAFAAVAQHVRGIIKQERMSATLLDRDKQKLELYAVDGRPGPIALGASYPVQGTAIGECVTRQKIMRLADLSASDYLENKGLLEQGLRSTLIVPLVSGRTVLGTLNMASSRVNAFDEQDEALLLQIAPLLASTIESQRLYAEAREQARRERMLNTIGQKIRGTVTLESALQTAVQEMARALDVPYAQLRMSTGRPEGAEEMLPLTPADMLPPWLDDDNDELQG
ncbi:MAG: GAF domain-containing protein, partial [Anaerolineales bacterium]|nr:GAF domain-containing protein [Anaerolineales bacterium]